MDDAPFRTLAVRTLHRNRWIELQQHEVEVRASGRRFTYTYLSSRPSVMVVALPTPQEILLIRQYRYPSRRFSYELPGGGAGGLQPEEAAWEELRQETGYSAGRLEKLGEFVVYCGLSDEICHAFLATELTPGAPELEETEHLSVERASLQRLDQMIATGEFADGMGLAALRLAGPRFER